MNLKEFIFYSNISFKEFSKKAGISSSYLSALVNGHKKPTRALAFYIEYLTNGKVKAENIGAPINYYCEIKDMKDRLIDEK